MSTLRIVLGVFVSSFMGVTAFGAGSGWLSDYDSALKKAEREALPIVVEFVQSDACEKCQSLEKDVWRSREFRNWSKDNVVLLSVDFPEKKAQSSRTKEQNEELKQRFAVESFPTIMVLSSSGEELSRLGYDGQEADAFVQELGKITDAANAVGGWITDFEKAKQLSKSTRRPILADFTGSDWCSWCIKLKKEVFDTEEFNTWAAKNVILLELDYPRRTEQEEALKEQNQALAKEYNIRGYPTVLFLDHKGKVLGQYGYDKGGPENWIQNAEEKMK